MSRFTTAGGGAGTPGPQGPQGPAGADANTADFTFEASTMSTNEDMDINVLGVPGVITLSAYAGVNVQTSEEFGLTTNKIITTSNGATDNIKIGDDAYIGDGNIANNIAIVGQQDATQGGVVFGSNETEQISTDGSNLSLDADNDIILNAGSSYSYLGTPLIDGSNRIATVGNLTSSFAEVSYTVSGGALGTQPTFNGAPLFAGSYTKTGNLVHFRVNVNMSNITNFGSGQYYVSIPFTSEYDVYVRNGQLKHSSGDMYSVSGHATAGSNELRLYTTASNGKEVAFTSSSPVGLNTTCDFHIFGSYFSTAN